MYKAQLISLLILYFLCSLTLSASFGASRKWNILIATGPNMNDPNLYSVFWVLNLENKNNKAHKKKKYWLTGSGSHKQECIILEISFVVQISLAGVKHVLNIGMLHFC